MPTVLKTARTVPKIMLPDIIIDELNDRRENSNSESYTSFYGEQLWYGDAGEADEEIPEEVETPKKCLAVGDTLPYGIRMFHGYNNIFRLKDVGVKNRILVVGVIGSFTPLCWNRHFLEVLARIRYYEERGIGYICCISTNDAFTQGAWGSFLGCYDNVLMVGDPSTAFTKAIGMDIVVPFLDSRVRSKRYIIYAEDMVVTKLMVSPQDDHQLKWNCDHINYQNDSSDTTTDDSGSSTNTW